jgi:cytochrome c-type biogenesis protein CcmE
MSHKAAKLGITGAVLALAFGGLLYTSLGESAEYYKHVDEVMASPQQWQGKKLQLHGFAHQIGRKRDALEYQFDVENKGKVIRAYYSGVVPDTFKEDAEVVLKGTLSPDGTFQVERDGVIAKCPSKYSPQAGGSAGAD